MTLTRKQQRQLDEGAEVAVVAVLPPKARRAMILGGVVILLSLAWIAKVSHDNSVLSERAAVTAKVAGSNSKKIAGLLAAQVERNRVALATTRQTSRSNTAKLKTVVRALAGEPGAAGALGLRGTAGALGGQGPSGSGGLAGAVGAAGESITGPAGPPGMSVTGPSGASVTGPTGESITGPVGPKGDAGAAGQDGAPGPPGPTPTTGTCTATAPLSSTFTCTFAP